MRDLIIVFCHSAEHLMFNTVLKYFFSCHNKGCPQIIITTLLINGKVFCNCLKSAEARVEAGKKTVSCQFTYVI